VSLYFPHLGNEADLRRPKVQSLSEPDVRAVVRLIGKAAGSTADVLVRKQELMTGLAGLVGADGWLWSVTRVQDGVPVCCGLLHGGLTSKQLTAWAESTQITDPELPEHPGCREICSSLRHATRTREQMVPDDKWYTNPTVRKYRLEVGIDDFLYSLYPLGEPGFVSAIGMYRHVRRPRFSARERRITHIVLSELSWLHTAGLPGDYGRSVPALSPRRRTVLVMLLNGMSRKEIGHALGISPNTAKDHIEAIYAHFRVTSQVELVRRFYCGDGGDTPRSPEALSA
jgi:DNA-binding CsgD family transcriptional regulator